MRKNDALIEALSANLKAIKEELDRMEDKARGQVTCKYCGLCEFEPWENFQIHPDECDLCFDKNNPDEPKGE